MEMVYKFIILTLVTVVSVCLPLAAWKVFNFVWLKPKKLEKCLRQQGFTGNSYKFLFGDSKEMANRSKQAKSKPISFSADSVPRIVPFIHKTTTDFGSKCFIWFGPLAAVLISDTEKIREILSKSYVFQKPYNPAAKMVALGLVSYETTKWAKHRRLISPAFQLDKLKHMVPLFYLSCCDMLSKWDTIVSSEGGSSELDVWPYLQTLTSDAISRSSFGSSCEEGRKIHKLQTEQIMLLITKATFMSLIPGWRFLPTKTNRRMKEIKKNVEQLVLGIIEKRMKVLEEGGASSNDLLDMLLESNLKEIQQHGNKFGMSMQEVVEECKLFYLAGQETTSTLLVWTMILLGKHVDWQARAREEVLQVVGSRKPDLQELNSLKIVSMILHEVLRLYPPAPLLSRTVHKDTELGDLTLPADVLIILPTILLHHDCNLWGSDAKEFNPERFEQGVAKATRDHLTYFPFGWGPRICIGQNFAMLEAKMALATILQRYSFELSSTYAHAPHIFTTIQPQHGAHLVLRKL